MGEALDAYTTELMDQEAFEKYWPYISKELDTVPHIWERWYTKESIYQMSLAGEFRVWGVGPLSQVRFVLFTQFIQYNASRTLQLTIGLGNDIENCLPSLIATLEKIANDTGCQYCEIIGRRGWKKLVPDFEEVAVLLVRKLEHFRVQ